MLNPKSPNCNCCRSTAVDDFFFFFFQKKEGLTFADNMKSQVLISMKNNEKKIFERLSSAVMIGVLRVLSTQNHIW